MASVVSTTATPPFSSVGPNFSMEGWLRAISAVGRVMNGEPMASSESDTLQFAVPPRISGP